MTASKKGRKRKAVAEPSVSVDEAVGGYVSQDPDLDTKVAPNQDLAPVILDPQELGAVAKTMNELFAMVQVAKSTKVREVIVTRHLLKHVLQDAYTDDTDSMMFHNVMLYVEGTIDAVKKKNARTTEDVLFGHSTAPIDSGALIGSGQVGPGTTSRGGGQHSR